MSTCRDPASLARRSRPEWERKECRGKALYLGPDGALVLRSDEGLVLRLSWVNETSIRTTNSEELNGVTI